MDILEKIDTLRKERGWSINNLAMEALLTQSTVNNLYARKTEPKISTLRALCNAFGITLSEFFSEPDKPDTIEKQIYNKVCTLTSEQKQSLLILLKSMK